MNCTQNMGIVNELYEQYGNSESGFLFIFVQLVRLFRFFTRPLVL